MTNLYTEMAQRFPSGSRFVEVGCWLGRSTAFLAVEIMNSGKAITVDCVDTWQGSANEPGMRKFAQDFDLFSMFWRNMSNGCVTHLFRPLMMPSVRAARCYDDGELAFVFIDGEHTYDAVSADIAAWKPKVMAGGVLAGHDYDQITDPGVVAAVDESLPQRIARGRCWMVEV